MSVCAVPVRCVLIRAGDFSLRHFDDGTVVYDEADGSLQALNPVAGQALGLLLTHGSLTPTEMAQAMLLDAPSEDELAQVLALMRQFESLGFVKCVPE